MALVGWSDGLMVGLLLEKNVEKCGNNVSEMINEWGAYTGVLPQTADPQSREVSVHKESLQIDCRIQV